MLESGLFPDPDVGCDPALLPSRGPRFVEGCPVLARAVPGIEKQAPRSSVAFFPTLFHRLPMTGGLQQLRVGVIQPQRQQAWADSLFAISASRARNPAAYSSGTQSSCLPSAGWNMEVHLLDLGASQMKVFGSVEPSTSDNRVSQDLRSA